MEYVEYVMAKLKVSVMAERNKPYRCLVFTPTLEQAWDLCQRFSKMCKDLGLECNTPTVRSLRVKVGDKTYSFHRVDVLEQIIAGAFIDEWISTVPLGREREMFLLSRNPKYY